MEKLPVFADGKEWEILGTKDETKMFYRTNVSHLCLIGQSLNGIPARD